LISYADAPELHSDVQGDRYRSIRAQRLKDSSAPKDFVCLVIKGESGTEWWPTGRLYSHNTDMNYHTPFLKAIYSSNLCQEIGLPTSGYKSVTLSCKFEGGYWRLGYAV
jgi:ribonucleoside-diphosphate reductase alpha chain